MDYQALLDAAKKAGREGSMSWWSSDKSDGPVNPKGAVHVEVLGEAGQALIELGAAEASGDGARLVGAWEEPGELLEYARAWARPFAQVLRDAGLDVRLVEELRSDKLDTSSLERGLEQVMHLGRISVEDILAERKIYVTRIADFPIILEVTEAQRASAGADAYLKWVRGEGFEVRDGGGTTRVNLGRDREKALPAIVEALKQLEDSPVRTLVARYAPGRAKPW